MKRTERVRILVVERDENVAEVLKSFLSGIGDVALATNMEEAVNLFSEVIPEVVVMNNLEPPEKEGIEIVKELKRISPDTKILIYTSYPSVVEEALSAGADDFAIKPLDRSDLVRFVERNL